MLPLRKIHPLVDLHGFLQPAQSVVVQTPDSVGILIGIWGTRPALALQVLARLDQRLTRALSGGIHGSGQLLHNELIVGAAPREVVGPVS